MNIKKILIINPYGIGDVLFTTPIIHTLKDVCPDAKIGYLCNRRTEAILKNNPYIDFLFVYERDEFEKIKKGFLFLWLKEIFAFLNRIKKEHFDMVFDFSLNSQYGFFSWYAGIKQRIGYDFKNRGRFLTHKIKMSGYNEKHIVEYYADLLEYAGFNLKYKNLELYIKDEDKKKVEEMLTREGVSSSDNLLGIIPGAGRSWGRDAQIKHWSTEKFAQLADKVIENYNAKVIIMGDFWEKELVMSVGEKMHHKAIDLSSRTTIAELAALLNKMKVIIANDGGPLHMAVALGVKTVSVFGPVDEKVYGPYPASDNHSVIKKDFPCRPCYKNFRFTGCSFNRRCINDITVDEVLIQTERLLKK